MSTSSKQVVLAVDLGGTTVEIALVESSGTVLAQRTFSTRDFPQPKDFAKRLVSERQALESELGKAASAVGIGAPSGNFKTGMLESAFNLKWGQGVPLQHILEEALQLPVVLDNDANVAALGAGHFGACRGLQDFVVITLGTGVGAGLVSSGHLIRGSNGLAGEFGHASAQGNGRLCGCGRRGCIEAYGSSAGLSQTFAEINAEAGITLGPIDAKQIHKRALAKDRQALETFERSGRYFARPLADLMLLLAPEMILFTGGVAAAGQVLKDPIQRHLKAELGSLAPPCQLLFDTGSVTAITGAAALVASTTLER